MPRQASRLADAIGRQRLELPHLILRRVRQRAFVVLNPCEIARSI
jgi:hypothetical protein